MSRWRSRSLAVLLGVLILGALGACGDNGGPFARWLLKPDDIIIERRPDPYYEQLFPHYAELCTISQMRRLDGRQGNPFGHTLMYLKGACKDEAAPFPLLRRCRGTATTLDDPEHGAAVSVGRWLRNVNWVAVPGYELVFTGKLKPGEPLTEAAFARAVQAAIDAGVFDGVELHPGWTRGEDRSLERYVTDASITADFALQFARNVFCARIPVSEAVLSEIIAFLNDKNYEYATGKVDYNWNLFANNCVHTVRNALAAANVWAPMSVLGFQLRHLFNLAVPANEFVNLAVLGADGPLREYRAIQGEGPSRDAFHDFNWLPTRHGALVKTLPVHTPNEIYHTDFRLFAVQSPFTMGKTRLAVKFLSSPEVVDLEANLSAFVDIYGQALANHEVVRDPLASVRGTPFRRVERLHFAYLEAQRADAAALLDRVKALKAAAPLPALAAH